MKIADGSSQRSAERRVAVAARDNLSRRLRIAKPRAATNHSAPADDRGLGGAMLQPLLLVRGGAVAVSVGDGVRGKVAVAAGGTVVVGSAVAVAVRLVLGV